MPTKVIVENHIMDWEARIEGAVSTAMAESLPILTAKAAGLATARYNIQGVAASVHPIPITRGLRGLECGVGASDWKSVFYEKGTKAHSNTKRGSIRLVSEKTGKGVRSAGGTPGFVSGVSGQHYLAKAVYSTFPGFIQRIKAIMA